MGDITQEVGAACAVCTRPLGGLVLVAERFVLRRNPADPESQLDVVLDARAHAECALESNRDGWIIDLSPPEAACGTTTRT